MDINIISSAELEKLNQLIKESNNIITCCHKSPDGDALGASLAWTEYIENKGKSSKIIIPDAYPDFLQWLPNTERIIRYDKHKEYADGLLENADLIFCLDFNGTNRVDEMQESLENSPAKLVMIDHHLNPQLNSTIEISFPELSSTSEIVFRLFWQDGQYNVMSKKCATCIYCGMMTDTGGFTYNSNAPEIFFIISMLLSKNINKDKIYHNVYNNFSSWAIRMRGYLMYNKLNVINDLNASYFSISRKTMKDFHFIKGDAEGLVNEPLKIKGMKLSISLREDDRKDNLIWVSLRSTGCFPCNEMAEVFFNGGGHLNASGGKLHCPLEDAEELTKKAIMHYESMLK